MQPSKNFHPKHLLLRASIASALGACVLFAVPAAEARITKVEVNPALSQSPTFGGYSWADVGQYEKVVGKAYGELDPADPKNAVIVDLALAPRNANGKVEYAFDFYILKPIDMTKSNRRVMYEPPNRGRKTWGALARVTVDAGGNGNDPGSSITNPTVLENSFLMPRGYTMVWSGWDKSAGSSNANFNTTVTLPVAKGPGGATITGPSYEYIVSSGATPFALAYPAASLDQSTAKLTHRVRLDDPPQVVPASNWAYDATGNSITVTGGWVAGDIYEFTYTAKDPTVNGIGFAAVRDWNAWLRYELQDDFGHANPLAGNIKKIYTEVSSQPGRLLNDFRNLGFNQAENGKQVFDGMMQWIAAGDGLNLNYRFSQPGRTERNRQDHLYLEGVFPFAHNSTQDPLTGVTAGRYDKCKQTNTCPRAVEIFSANEYWVKAASLMHTNPKGKKDLDDVNKARLYLMSSMQHGTGNATSKGSCQQFGNPLDSSATQRALWVALDKWERKDKEPPASRVPRFDDGTLVAPLPQSGMGFPNIPGVQYTGLKTTRYLFNYGPNFYATGIMTTNPPIVSAPYQDNLINGPIYPSYIPKTDADGNDIAGIRLPDLVVPLATYTGWSLRAGAQAGDGCESAGQFIPFPRTAADRAATADPRVSVAERYPTFEDYDKKVAKAVKQLVKDKLLLCEDVVAERTRLQQAGLLRGVPAPVSGVLPVIDVPGTCKPKDPEFEPEIFFTEE